MGLVVMLLSCATAFGVCMWSGHQLASHYQDSREVAAVVAIGCCLLVLLALLQQVGASSDLASMAGVLGAGMGGLFLGYFTGHRAT